MSTANIKGAVQTVGLLHSALVAISRLASDVAEDAGHFRCEGFVSPEAEATLRKALHDLQQLAMERYFALDVGDESVDLETLSAAVADNETGRWVFQLSKADACDSIFKTESVIPLYFSRFAPFQAWAENLSPFLAGERGQGIASTLVLVDGLQEGFGGPFLAVIPPSEKAIPEAWNGQPRLPTDKEIKKQVHNLLSATTTFEPNEFDLTWGAIHSDAAEPFRRALATILAASLVQDFSTDAVALRGVKRIDLPLRFESEKPTIEDIRSLTDAACWVYEERTETRAKLLAQRLTLELHQEQSLLSQLPALLPDALRQAKEQYGFVILERADEHARELRDLLKDIRGQTDLYAEKTRAISASLLRDTLAILFLLTLSFVSRVSHSQSVLTAPEVELIFTLSGSYLLVSLALQLIIHVRDITLSNREVERWIAATRQYMNKQEVKRHINSNVEPRKHNLYTTLFLLSIVYIVLAIACLRYQVVLELLGYVAGGPHAT